MNERDHQNAQSAQNQNTPRSWPGGVVVLFFSDDGDSTRMSVRCRISERGSRAGIWDVNRDGGIATGTLILTKTANGPE